MDDTNIDATEMAHTQSPIPDEKGSILIEAFVRIKDPNTQEVLVETRA